MFNNDRSKLFLYVTISLIFHLLLFYFFPFGYLQGFSNEEASGENFGYVQYVEYKTQSNQKTEEETKPEPEEVSEENQKKEIEEPEEEIEEEEVEPEEEVEEDTTDQEDVEITQDKNVQEEVEETENEQEQEIISSEESESEVKVKQEEKPTEEPEEEIEEELEPEEEVEETPPPPPTAGELIGLSPKPVYPKYLVSEAKNGKVGLSVQVDPNGEVENIIITNSSNTESMDRNARLTIENGWEFRNYKQRYKINVTVNYNIDNNGNPNVNIEIGKVNFL